MLRAFVVIAIAFIILVGLLWGISAAQTVSGIECSYIRKLTTIERKYWIWRLGLSQEQVSQIRKVCGVR
jgi:hypothetical protein